MANDPHFEPAAAFFQQLQDRIVGALETLDGRGTFRCDDWTRGETEPANPDAPVLHGWGRTRVLEGGDLIERGGVNFSLVRGRFQPGFAATMPGDGLEFAACGISLVLHPRNPHVPIVHMNYRRLHRGSVAWFGGGADLTPCYFEPDDAAHFHAVHRQACESFADVVAWEGLVEACDRYFYLPHRGERRGVGGLFFDHATADPERTFAFVQAVGSVFLPAWTPIAERRRNTPFGDRERFWQLLRRGRYVEFNLVCDRGTLFGLKTGGRIESILMSMPPLAGWQYDMVPEPGSREAEMVRVVQQGYRPSAGDFNTRTRSRQ
jgi:coproporphyrinogen III oxidase